MLLGKLLSRLKRINTLRSLEVAFEISNIFGQPLESVFNYEWVKDNARKVIVRSAWNMVIWSVLSTGVSTVLEAVYKVRKCL